MLENIYQKFKQMQGYSSSVNKKKISQRLAKENKYKEFPLLNLYILIITILEVIGEIMDIHLLRMLKPFPIILMIIYISNKNSSRNHLTPTLVKYGLVLSLIGDLLLMINEISAFMIGTCFFLIAHILYCVALTIGEKVRSSTQLNRVMRKTASIGLLILCFVNIYQLWDVMPNRLLFSVYGIVLCIMNIFSINRYEITTPYSYAYMCAGSILFGLSDNLLAMLKFNGISSSLGRGMVMLLYYSGQYLLMHGAILHSNLQFQISKYMKGNSVSIGVVNVNNGSKNWENNEEGREN